MQTSSHLTGLGARASLCLLPIVMLFVFGCGKQKAGQEQATQNKPAAALEANVLTASEKKEAWELLFDGKTTTGWRGINQEAFPEQGWEIADGRQAPWQIYLFIIS